MHMDEVNCQFKTNNKKARKPSDEESLGLSPHPF